MAGRTPARLHSLTISAIHNLGLCVVGERRGGILLALDDPCHRPASTSDVRSLLPIQGHQRSGIGFSDRRRLRKLGALFWRHKADNRRRKARASAPTPPPRAPHHRGTSSTKAPAPVV